MPVANFGTVYMMTLEKALSEPVILKFPTKQGAYTVRRRLYGLRAEMRKEFHPLADEVEAVEISVYQEEGGPAWILAVQMSGEKFSSVFEEAGLPSLSPEEAKAYRERMGMAKGEPSDLRPGNAPLDAQDDYIAALFAPKEN